MQRLARRMLYVPLIPMRRFFRALKLLTRSKLATREDKLRTESRAEMARMAAQGRAWEQMGKNVSHLGIDTKSGSKAQLVYGAGRRGKCD